jgi:hypothetical protein
MSTPILTKTRFANGQWHGLLTGAPEAPALEALHLGEPVPDVAVTETGTAGEWAVTVPIPPAAIADGVQTVVIRDRASGVDLGAVSLLAGDAAGDDLRAEIDLLRAELDLLKRAFRQHCRDSGAS